MRTVGVVGLGKMGLTIACRLRRLGTAVVAYNRTGGRGRPLVDCGGVLLGAPAEVAERVDLLLTAVYGPDDVRAVLLGPDGVCHGANRGLTVVDLSTIDAESSRAIAAEVGAYGITMLDAPMSGSVPAARDGSLGLLVGGDRSSLERARPTLSLFARFIYHFGPSGAGCLAKLGLNLLVGAMVQSLSEAMALVRATGLSPELFLEAIGTSGLASPLFGRAGHRALSGDLEARFSLRALGKDLRLLLREAERTGVELRLARALEELVAAAVADLGELDYSSLIAAAMRRISTGDDCTYHPDRKELLDESVDQPDLCG
jgi:3-hydroxyisobutyrate dehydrogenase-like beta-hydroxyacid dehydrogenase